MSKVSLTVSIDGHLMKELDGKHKSEVVNRILTRALKTEEGIEAEIKEYENRILALNQELKDRKAKKKENINGVSDYLKLKLVEEKRALDNNPQLASIRSRMFNEKHKIDYSEDEYTELVNKWG